MKKISVLFLILILATASLSVKNYRLLLIGDSNTLVYLYAPMRSIIPIRSYNWQMVGAYDNANGIYAMLGDYNSPGNKDSVWNIFVTPFVTDTNRLWIRYSTGVHDADFVTPETFALQADTLLRRFKAIVGTHIILASYPRVSWAYSAHKDSLIVKYNDSMKAVADRVLGAGYVWDDWEAWYLSLPDSTMKMNSDGLHWNSYVYTATTIRTADILQTIWERDSAKSYSYSSSGLPAIDNTISPSLTINYSYSSSGLFADDLVASSTARRHRGWFGLGLWLKP